MRSNINLSQILFVPTVETDVIIPAIRTYVLKIVTTPRPSTTLQTGIRLFEYRNNTSIYVVPLGFIYHHDIEIYLKKYLS